MRDGAGQALRTRRLLGTTTSRPAANAIRGRISRWNRCAHGLMGRGDDHPDLYRTTGRLYVRSGAGPEFAALPGTPLRSAPRSR